MKKILTTLIIIFAVTAVSSASAVDVLKSIFEQAMHEFAKGNYQEAIKLYEKTLEIHPQFAPSYNYMGMAHKEAGTDLKEVISLFQKAVEIDPDYVLAYDNLCKAYYGIADFDGAEKNCLKAVELDPGFVSSKLALAWIYLLGRSQPGHAISYFEEVVNASDEDIPYAQFGLGLAYFMSGEKFKTLEMITTLKMNGHEKFAVQLENMIRDNSYVPKVPEGMPLLPSATLAKDKAIDFSSFAQQDAEDVPVRIKSDPADGDVSGQEKIRELQKNSQKYQNEPDY